MFGLITNIEEQQKTYNHAKKSISQEFRLKDVDERRNCLMEKINQNELMNKKHKKVSRNLIILNTYLL